MTRVLLADDHGVVLQGLEALLATEPEFEVVGMCRDGTEVVESVARIRPDVLVMDVRMPRLGGIEAMGEMADQGTLPPTILISALAAPGEVSRALALGAWGMIMKDQAPAVIVESIHALRAGESWTPEVHLRRLGFEPGEALCELLTEREFEVALRAARGESNKAIARLLGIAVGTVKVHLHRTYRKLGLGNRVELALNLRELGAIEEADARS